MTSHASKSGSSIRAKASAPPFRAVTSQQRAEDGASQHSEAGDVPARGGSTSTPLELSRQALESTMEPGSQDDKTVISKRPPAMDVPLPGLMTTQHLGQALIGKTLEHYELVEFVGGGGMGAVFRANDTRLGRTVAVKVLSRDQTDEETIRRFRNEAQSAARLDHPNIARVHYVGEENGWNYIVFEFIEGTNLRDVVEQLGPLPLEDALSYTLQVTEALKHASSRDVVHRDIKPSNVLLMDSGEVKLVDMGLARLHQVQSSSEDLTASGVTLGTFDYISPEQARDPRVADVRSDIYSLGCTLFYMLVGQPPFPDGTALQKLLRHNADEPPDVRQFRPELSPKVSALVARMLAKRPAQRFQTPADLIHEILLVAEHVGLSSLARRGSDWVAPQAAEPSLWSRALPIAVPLVLLIAGLVFVDAYLAGGTPDTDYSLRPKLFAAPVVAPPEFGPESAPHETLENPKNTPLPPTTDFPQVEPPGGEPPRVAPAVESPAATPDPAMIAIVPRGADSAAVAATTVEPPEAALPATETTVAKVGVAPESVAIGPTAIGDNTEIAVGSAPASEAAPATKIAKLIVVPGAEPLATADTETVGTFAAACKRAAELGVVEIELQFDGELLEQPFEIAASKLSVRAAPGMRPSIVFRPQSAGVAADRLMLRSPPTGTSRLQFQGIDFRLELPADSASGWALFSLNPQQMLELSDCTITVRDYGQFEAPMHSNVGMIAVHSRRTSEMMMLDDEMAMAQSATISLDGCVARGQAALVTMPDETPLRIVWNQGLLVSTQHLIETGGTAIKPKVLGSQIEIDLDRVTMIAKQGLYQMRRRSGAAYQLDVDVQSDNSILSPGSDAALFEFSGVNSIEEIKLTFGGADNCYPREDLPWLRMKLASSATATDFGLNNRNRWSVERRPDPAVIWQSPPPASLPAHLHTKQNYVISDATMSDAGFDPETLPDTAPSAVPPMRPAPVPPQPLDDAPAVPEDDENVESRPLLP